MIFKHYYFFDKDTENMIKGKLDKKNWDILRTEMNDTNFAIEKTVEEYESNCIKNATINDYIEGILKYIEEKSSDKIISFGCGKGILEWNLLNHKTIDLTCSDYTEQGLKQLESVFKKCNSFLLYDMLNGNPTVINSYDLAIMFRLSTEFSINEWKRVFKKIHEARINNIVFIPTEVADLRLFYHEVGNHIYRRIKRIDDVFCGYCYTIKEFNKMWNDYYEIERKVNVNNNVMFLLKSK